jgi:hypothetical protein
MVTLSYSVNFCFFNLFGEMLLAAAPLPLIQSYLLYNRKHFLSIIKLGVLFSIKNSQGTSNPNLASPWDVFITFVWRLFLCFMGMAESAPHGAGQG